VPGSIAKPAVGDGFQASRDEFERIRQLIPERADFHLANWGVWSRGYRPVTGFSDHTPGLRNMSGCAAAEYGDHLYESEFGHWAEITDVVIDSLDLIHRIAISNLYEASVANFPRGDFEDRVVIAARLFWDKATRQGLM
jgi:hypothetical protein